MSTPTTSAAASRTIPEVATDSASREDGELKELPSVDALREALHKAVADADESALGALALAHNRTVNRAGVGDHIYPPVPARLMPITEQLMEDLEQRSKTPPSEYLSWDEVKSRLLARFG